MHLLPPRHEMEQAFFSSDESYNGLFFTGVRTTGIFCLPSCPARKPLPQNIDFFGSVKDAMFAGYRPCKRCRPTQIHAPEWVQALLDRIDADPGVRITESELRSAGLEPARVRRHFVREFGMTFQAYCRARRLTRALNQIRNGAPLDDATFDSGFDSHSGFRTAFARFFGKPPGQTRHSSQQDDCIYLSWIETPIGPLLAGSVNKGVCLLEFTDRRMLEKQVQRLSRCFPHPIAPGENSHLAQLKAELAKYFLGHLRHFTTPIVYPGTTFEQSVWTELLRIPYGETRSYEALACAIGQPGASRAVGRANGMNRISILIPCHRVVNKGGELGGYGGGLWRKRILLDLERTGQAIATLAAHHSSASIPGKTQQVSA